MLAGIYMLIYYYILYMPAFPAVILLYCLLSLYFMKYIYKLITYITI